MERGGLGEEDKGKERRREQGEGRV